MHSFPSARAPSDAPPPAPPPLPPALSRPQPLPLPCSPAAACARPLPLTRSTRLELLPQHDERLRLAAEARARVPALGHARRGPLEDAHGVARRELDAARSVLDAE